MTDAKPTEQESNLVSFARHELSLIRSGGPDEMQDAIDAHVLAMVGMFADEGHSGMSAPYTIGLLMKLLAFEPLTPLTGADDEWNEVGEGQWQNRRCSHVFKDATGHAYDINGRIFREPSGSCFTSHDSRVTVVFPYTPTREYVDVDVDVEADR